MRQALQASLRITEETHEFSLFLFHRYLVEGPEGNILHTGDFRAEPRFRNAISKNPHLLSYLSLPKHADDLSSASGGGRVTRIGATLDAIYLDTACVWSDIHQPSKVGFIFTARRTIHLHLINVDLSRKKQRSA